MVVDGILKWFMMAADRLGVGLLQVVTGTAAQCGSRAGSRLVSGWWCTRAKTDDAHSAPASTPPRRPGTHKRLELVMTKLTWLGLMPALLSTSWMARKQVDAYSKRAASMPHLLSSADCVAGGTPVRSPRPVR